MFKIIGILLGVICVLIIAKLIINKIKENKEKEIDFNEFDDIEKIKLTKHDKQHMENEWKALQKVKLEQEYYQQMKKEKEREKQRKKEKLKQERRIKDPKEQEMDNLIDTVNFINDSIVNTVEAINKKIEDKEKREDTKILEDFEPDMKHKIYEGAEINEIKENDDNFNIDLFKKWSEGIFLCIEIGQPQELEIIKNSILSNMYHRLIKNINKLKQDNLKLQREDILIEETKLLDYGKHTNKEEMKILIKAQMKEYIMNIQNKKVIRESKNKIKEKNIIMTFHKKNDHLEQEGFLGSCPNCGAPISQIEFGKCKYCGTVVVPIRYNWVLVKFETI